MMAWCKVQLGWINVTEMTGGLTNYTILPTSNSTTGIHTIKIPLSLGFYYLIEVRRWEGFDAYLPDEGVLITQVNETRSSGHGIVVVVDAAPTTTSLNDGAFDIGPTENDTFTDLQEGIRIEVEAENTTGYTVETDDRNPALVPETTVLQLPSQKAVLLKWTVPNITTLHETQFWFGTKYYEETTHSTAAIAENGIYKVTITLPAQGFYYGVIYAQELDGTILMSQRIQIYATNETTSIFIVDDDGGETYETYFTTALDSLSYTSYVVWDYLQYGTPAAELLQFFPIVIWATGWAFPSLNQNDMDSLATYLNQGGALFITGQDIGWDLNDKGYDQWMTTYLKATYVSDDSGDTSILGVTNDAISDGLSFEIAGGTGADNQQYPSEITPANGAHAIFTYASAGTTAGIAYKGIYALVYLAFGYEGIADSTSRTTLMQRIVTYLATSTNVSIITPTSRL